MVRIQTLQTTNETVAVDDIKICKQSNAHAVSFKFHCNFLSESTDIEHKVLDSVCYFNQCFKFLKNPNYYFS